ncbi:uncharacterized protein LOC129721129 [Wyeomyia smithii]|uniref:uncharacterized protein LOC129721129 n=1 Tax=Wyeomyia smithii TaxID=174621 RepID=UPI002467B185|nr:uncharacterized protein LOC129721129 [Wyeomyia smithii]XP_055529283.1 uncharacterized protein LOC129721129 [Wyeomyia smithii]XP_055529284.1 uncharacterized protein LOC129721129 [Wyeomyia smithii]
MHARGGSQWQSRRKPSLGPLRRAHPASGATWNVQVVRGKMTSRCLWHACRALALGIVLMLVGGGMATVGYYANNFPSLSDVKSNSTSTIRVKNEHRGLHLNNLSYVGPIIMGVGGFIVVASCVMTFEARDSAAKVVPARFKLSGTARNPSRSNMSRRSTSTSNGPASVASQTARWEQHLGVFRTSPAVEQVTDRKALTAALVHFSKALGTPKAIHQPCESRRVSRSGSVPNLTADKLPAPLAVESPACARSVVRHHHRGSRVSSMVHRSTRETNGSLLHPGTLHQMHRHAQSVDEPEPFMRHSNQSGSHGSMHYGCYPNDVPAVQKLRDRNKRSDTARKHVLSRQTKFEKDEPSASPRHNPFAVSRRSSTISNASSKMNRSSRRASTVSKTPSVDSRGALSTAEVNSPDPSVQAMTPRKANGIGQMSTPPVERECRSQLSICSEPTIGQRNLSCQSSLEPCLPEEDSPEQDEPQPGISSVSGNPPHQPSEVSHQMVPIDNSSGINSSPPVARPDSLVLSGRMMMANSDTGEKTSRFLHRSNSTKSCRKPKPKIKSKKLSNEFDQIYVISSTSNEAQWVVVQGDTGCNRYPNFYHTRDDEYYDSIEVIHERRSKNFSKFNSVCDELQQTTDVQQKQETAEEQEQPTSCCPVGESLGANKFSVVADISPAMANLHPADSPEKSLPEKAIIKMTAFDSSADSAEGKDDTFEFADDDASKEQYTLDHNSSIQRYDTVIYNATSSSIESADAGTDTGCSHETVDVENVKTSSKDK